MEPDKNERALNALSPQTRHWLREQVVAIALRHDVTGPLLSNLEPGNYREAVAGEIRRAIVAAQLAGEIELPTGDVKVHSDTAAAEVLTIRQLRHAHEAGSIASGVLLANPLFEPYREYIESSAAVVVDGLLAALDQREELQRRLKSVPLPQSNASEKQPGRTLEMSGSTLQWIQTQVLGLLLFDSTFVSPSDLKSRSGYLKATYPKLREHAEMGCKMGILFVDSHQLDELCRLIAVEALHVKNLKATRAAGILSPRKLRRHALYKKYQEYFDNEAALQNLVAQVTGEFSDMQPRTDSQHN